MNPDRISEIGIWFCLHMKTAVHAAVLEAEFDGPRGLARWGRRVKEAFFDHDGQARAGADFFLETVDRAVQEMLSSEHRDLLLADALAHPAKFAQTVGMMMHISTHDQEMETGCFAKGKTLH